MTCGRAFELDLAMIEIVQGVWVKKWPAETLKSEQDEHMQTSIRPIISALQIRHGISHSCQK